MLFIKVVSQNKILERIHSMIASPFTKINLLGKIDGKNLQLSSTSFKKDGGITIAKCTQEIYAITILYYRNDFNTITEKI